MKLEEYVDLSNKQINLFEKYKELLIEWNEKINLTAITEEDEIVLKHFIDSLSIAKYVDKNCKLIDIGTGAGFPGIPIKIFYEDLEVTLLDSLNKRVTFLKDVIGKLELKKIDAIHSRAEECACNAIYREKYDIAVARAVSNLSTLLEYLMPYVKVGGKCICMKGPNINEELNLSKNALRELGGEIEMIENFKLPDSNLERNIIIIKKVKNTDRRYPRKAGIPAKKPL